MQKKLNTVYAVLLVAFCVCAVYAENAVTIDRGKKTVLTTIQDRQSLYEDALRAFIVKNGGKKNLSFNEFYNGETIIFTKPASAYFAAKHDEIHFDPVSNRFSFKSKITAGLYKNASLYWSWTFSPEVLYAAIDREYAVFPESLSSCPEFRQLLITALDYNNMPLASFGDTFNVSLSEDSVQLSFKLKNVLPKLSSKLASVNPSALKISAVCTGQNSYTAECRTAAVRYFKSMGLPIIEKAQSGDYILTVVMQPAFEQQMPAVIKTKMVSWRAKGTMTLTKNGRTFFTDTISAAAVNMSPEMAAQNASTKTAGIAAEKALLFIIKDMYSIQYEH